MARNHIPNRSIFSHHKEWKHELGEQLIIRVGKWCNFRCVFCNVAENESVLSVKSSIKEILAMTFYKIKYSNFDSKQVNVTISWGEPSIFQKETLFILKYFRKYFESRWIQVSFDLQSNASNIDKAFAKQIAQLGIMQALISSHTHDPEIFKKVIWVSYETMWPRFESGVQNLIDAGIFVTFNIVLNKMTAEGYVDHLKYLLEKYPSVQLYNIWYVQPHGMAQENFASLVAPYKDIAKIYNTAIAFLKSRWKTVHSHFVGLPLCYMDDWVTSMEYVNNVSIVQVAWSEKTLIQSINDSNKVHPNQCTSCIAKRVCSGVWKEYASNQELNPMPYEVRYSWVWVDTVDTKSIKKSYDGGKRQFFFLLDEIWDRSTLQEIQSLGFIWISLILAWEQDVPILTEYASTNLQIHLTLQNIEKWLDAISLYNSSVPFQLQIQGDLILADTRVDRADIHRIKKTTRK